VCISHVLKGHYIEAVEIHVERHRSSFGRRFENDRRSERRV
jgi:hypothetical protein